MPLTIFAWPTAENIIKREGHTSVQFSAWVGWGLGLGGGSEEKNTELGCTLRSKA